MLLLSAALAASGGAAVANPAPTDLIQLSLEELMEVQVTSAARKAQPLTEAAAAVSVLTGEDIRRAGARSIPEALRLVPGVQVARIDASKWAVSIRGFNGRFANKLLVLIDGRSVYTPLFSGVFWEQEDVFLEDVDRIEVIRGPGAALWGANAVNGVINIITKPAAETQGGLVVAGAGTEERAFGAVRYGGHIGSTAHYRAFVKHDRRDDQVFPPGREGLGEEANDAWHVSRAGFRTDWDASADDLITVQGAAFTGKAGETVALPQLDAPFTRIVDEDNTFAGGFLLGRWVRALSATSDLAVQASYERNVTDLSRISFVIDTFELDLSHRFAAGERHDLQWGLDYRFFTDRIDDGFILAFEPDSDDGHVLSVFVQDDITLVPERLRLTLGSRFEYNDDTGFEIQPNARLWWAPAPGHAAWTSVSRAVRTPSRLDDAERIVIFTRPGFGGPPVAAAGVSEGDAETEDLLALEAGYRVQPADNLSLDIATFYNIYDNLRSLEPGRPFLVAAPTPFVVDPVVGENKLEGEAYGVEVAAEWRPRATWRLRATYSFLSLQLHPEEDSRDVLSEREEGQSPRHQATLQSFVNLTPETELDAVVRYVSELPALDIDGYVDLDLRLAWWPRQDLELSLVGQNLLGGSRLEFRPELLNTLPTEVERGVYGKITWRF